MFVIKLIATLLLLCCFIVGIRKADKKSHLHDYHPMAEYMAGFIFTLLSVWGFYYLWW
jgi:hypothetical protein